MESVKNIKTDHTKDKVNSLSTGDPFSHHGSWSTLVHVMACCLMAPSHYLNQWWHITNGILRHSHVSSKCNYTFQITAISFRHKWVNSLWPGPWFNMKTISYQYRKSHCGDKTILRPSYLHNGISYTGKMTSLYWIRAQVTPYGDMELGQHWLR